MNISYDEALANFADGKNNINDLYNELKKDIFVIVGDYHLAEDILQDTFLIVQTKSDTYQKGTNAKAWILTIARNLSYNALNRKKKELSLETFGDITANNSVADEVENIIDVAKALTILSEEERQILILHDVTGLMHKEIACILDLKSSTVRKKYTRLINKLYDYYKRSDKNDI